MSVGTVAWLVVAWLLAGAGFAHVAPPKGLPRKAAAKPIPVPPVESVEAFYRRAVEPVLEKSCVRCHAGVRTLGGLDLRALSTILKGGDSGPVLVPGDPEASPLYRYLLPDSGPRMPPDPKKAVSKEAAEAVRIWILRLPEAGPMPRDGSWIPGYMAKYRRMLDTHPPMPAGLAPSAAIDWFLSVGWKRNGATPAARVDDAGFVRRVHLDLAGRIPTEAERARFLADPAPDKRSRLVETLMASPEHARTLREVFDTVLMGRASGGKYSARADGRWHAFLEDAFLSNRPWNEVVRDILVARPAEGPRGGAAWFLRERDNQHEAIAEAVAPLVFGVKIGCAQCHNHPLAWEIEQRHYWGLVAAFNRSRNVDTDSGPAVAESAVGGFINFANLKKESQPAKLVFLNGAMVDETIPGDGVKETDDPALYVVPPVGEGKRPVAAAVPRFSRREMFARTATTDNPLLARAMVNRLWALFLGRGLVHPVDEIDSKHRPSHPELLEWLSRDFERNGYDVRRLVRALLLTNAYRMGTRPAGETVPRPESFARAVERPLTAEQFARSVRVALGADPNAIAEGEWEQVAMGAHPQVMPNTYNPPLSLALALTNGKVFDTMLRPAPGNTAQRLLDLPDPRARVHAAFALVLGRSPEPDELRACVKLLSSARPEAGVRDLLWALATVAEFLVNH